MFSVQQKRMIAAAVHQVLRSTLHPELPPEPAEVTFTLHVEGAEPWSWAVIRNNGAVNDAQAAEGANVHNEIVAAQQAPPSRVDHLHGLSHPKGELCPICTTHGQGDTCPVCEDWNEAQDRVPPPNTSTPSMTR